MSGLGEIPPSAELKVYYKLEDTSDSSPASLTLTNQNSVTFAAGKFTNAADFGSSGINKALTITTNPLSSNEPTDVSFSFWYKLNVTGSSNTNARFFEIVTADNTSTGLRVICFYNISGSNITITLGVTTTSGLQTVTKTFATDSNWHYVLARKIGNIISLSIDNGTLSTLSGIADRTTAGLTSTYRLAIGNSSFALNTQAWAMIDEFFITENNRGVSGIYFQYYTFARGINIA